MSHTSVSTDLGVIVGGLGFQIKRLSIRPHHALSLKAHRSQTQHWIVLDGTATIVRDDEILQLGPNQSTSILFGKHHRLANDTDKLLDVIEVLSGDHLGEDDIEWFADDSGRD